VLFGCCIAKQTPDPEGHELSEAVIEDLRKGKVERENTVSFFKKYIQKNKHTHVIMNINRASKC
jgi:hypothetical protein